jgi:hypothetical protein
VAGGGAGLEADLVLTASASSVTPSTNVTFTASATPAAVHNDWRLFAVQSWEWVPDSGSQTASCGTSKTCNFTPQSSGTMKVTALVNGTVQTEERFVSVLPCLTGDSLLDDARIRRALKEAWEGSNAGDPDQGDRRERLGGRFPDGQGGWTDTTFSTLPGATMCRSYDPAEWNWNTPGLGPPAITRHTHPASPGEHRTYGSCPERDTTPWPPGTTRIIGRGPSQSDYSSFFDIPFVVVDADYIHLTRWSGSPLHGSTSAYSRAVCDAAS